MGFSAAWQAILNHRSCQGYHNIEMEGIGSLTLPKNQKAPFEKFELSGNSKQGENPSPENPQEIKNSGKYDEESGKYVINVSVTGKNLINAVVERGSYRVNSLDKVNSDSTRCRASEIVYINKGFAGTLSISRNFQIYVRLFKGKNLVTESGAFVDEYSLNNSNNTFDRLTIVIRKKNNLKIDDIELKGIKIQLEHGSMKTNYEPYKEPQTIALQLDRPLTKWDRLEKRDGVYGIVYKHRTVDDFATLVKDNTIIYGSSGNRYFSIEIKDANLNYDYSKVYSEVGLYKKDINVLYVPVVQTNFFIVYVSDTDTIETAKEHLHYKVIYETDSEEFVPLPEEMQLALENLYANDGTTIVSVDSGEVETGIKLTYRKEK